MIKNYLKIAVRHFLRHRVFTLLNLSSLALGMTCCLLILLWVQDDFSVDRFHENDGELYAVVNRGKYGSDYITSQGAPPALANALETEYADIVKASRVLRAEAFQVRSGDTVIRQRYYAVDPQFLEMFSFGLETGDRATALDDPLSILMTREVARRIFGDANPMGRTVEIDNRFSFTVTGILEEVPLNSSFRFECLIPFQAMGMLWNDQAYLTRWKNWNSQTYVMTVPGADHKALSALIKDRINEANGSDEAQLSLKPFRDLYLYGVTTGTGRISSIILYAILGAIILGIACVNYMNLATARSTLRAREIGLRKVIGAYKKDII
ncbi:MAG TPA: ABC transporter permease, partial [Candidatus Krumholzibacterium sp.]|nr:ABC transporter permease [Candidatus Krumholzibacterium sp.]